MSDKDLSDKQVDAMGQLLMSAGAVVLDETFGFTEEQITLWTMKTLTIAITIAAGQIPLKEKIEKMYQRIEGLQNLST